MNTQQELISRLTDLASQAARRNTYTYSQFLSLADQDELSRIPRDMLPVRYSLCGGSPSCERQLAVFGSEDDLGYPPEPPIAVVSISPVSERYGEELSHRDYLGAVLNLGIDRGLTGDIVIRGKRAWMYCLDSICGYICDHLDRVRHTTVECAPVTGDVPELAPELQEISLNVSSERLDAVVAAFTGLSRGHVQTLFSEKRVYVNSRLADNASKPLKEGDVLNVRGFGKAVYDGVSGHSKKGRNYVALRKYV